MGIYLTNNEIANFLEQTDDCISFRDYAEDCSDDLTHKAIYELGMVSGKLQVMADLLKNRYEDTKNEG